MSEMTESHASPGEAAPAPSTPAQHYLVRTNGCASQDWQDGFNTAVELDRASRPAWDVVAWLHDVVQSDGEQDQALSFSPDSFPLKGVGGFESIKSTPLFLAPQATHNKCDADFVALQIASRFVPYLEPQRRAQLQVAIRDAICKATPPPATPAAGEAVAWNGDVFEAGYVKGYRAALGAAAAECRRRAEAIDHGGNTYTRDFGLRRCAIAISALHVPGNLNELSGNSGEFPIAWAFQEKLSVEGWVDAVQFTPPPKNPLQWRNVVPLYTAPPAVCEDVMELVIAARAMYRAITDGEHAPYVELGDALAKFAHVQGEAASA